MLESKTNQSRDRQYGKDNHTPINESAANFRSTLESVRVPKFFPVASNQKCCNSGVARGQVSGSNQPLTDEATLGQVLGLGPVGHEAGVPGGCRCCEGSNGSIMSFQAQRVFGVDSLYGRPANRVNSKDVVDNDTMFSYSNTWIPKQQPTDEGKPKIDPAFSQDQFPRLESKRDDSKASEENSSNGHYSSRSGVQGLTLHPISLTQPATPKGACC